MRLHCRRLSQSACTKRQGIIGRIAIKTLSHVRQFSNVERERERELSHAALLTLQLTAATRHYSNMAIGTLALNCKAVTFGTLRSGMCGFAPIHTLVTVPNALTRPSTSSVRLSVHYEH